MEKQYTTNAINLRSYDLSDADKIVLMYSKEKGLIRSVAKGVKRPKSKLGIRMDNLVANEILFNKGRNLDTISQVQTINQFKNLRKDILKLLISSYISEIIINYGVESDPSSSEVYDLLYNALEKIEKVSTKKDILLVVLRFQLKIMHLSGIHPELDYCLCCGEPILNENMYFSKDKCGVLCEKCNDKYHYSLKFHYQIRDFFKMLLNTNFDKETEFDKRATDNVCVTCFNILKDYIALHSDKKFKSDKVLVEML